MMAHYRNNKLHGKWAKYKFGQAVVVAMYKDGQLDGPYREFNQSGKLMKEINYREGKENGPLRYYNEQGEVTVEYEFRDGQKVGGGLKKPQ
jgi:antitoxin component YwqK of YwqJK toxin-antitoxin module